MAQEPYGTLAGVYEGLVPESVLSPEGCVAAFGHVVDALDPGARVLDCAAGIGQLAVGLRLRGFDVVASDASRAMLERAKTLAAGRGVDLQIHSTDRLTTHAERLAFWPFRQQTLDEDLRSVGLSPVSSTYAPERERYLVTATVRTSANS